MEAGKQGKDEPLKEALQPVRQKRKDGNQLCFALCDETVACKGCPSPLPHRSSGGRAGTGLLPSGPHYRQDMGPTPGPETGRELRGAPYS